MIEQMRRLVGRNAGRWKWLMLLEALGLAVAIPLAYLWAIFLLDNVVHLSSWGRYCGNGRPSVRRCLCRAFDWCAVLGALT